MLTANKLDRGEQRKTIFRAVNTYSTMAEIPPRRVSLLTMSLPQQPIVLFAIFERSVEPKRR
jgi:hypothetical protein